MLRSVNVATPDAEPTVNVPDRVPPPGFVPIAIVTLPAKPVAVLPPASSAVTWTAGVITAPAPALEGGTVNASFVAVPARMLNALLVPVNAPDVAPSR